ncbi:MAG: S8 family serine peptidase [Pseudomonadales bacterium]
MIPWRSRLLPALLAVAAGAGLAGSSSAAQPDDPYLHSRGSWGQNFDDQWALDNLRVYTDVAGTHDSGQRRATVVAVIDTGLDYTHEDFAAARLWRNAREENNGFDDDGNGYVDDLVGWNFVDGSNNPWDTSGHGTHIAGIIAACTNNGLGIAGVDGDALIMPLKVANFVGQARSSAVAAAVYYAVDHGARVINLSLGSELVTDLEREAAEYAAANGVLIVVSAGNRGQSTDSAGYASLPGVLVVGASGLDGERAGFSNFGSHLELLAPGVDVLSLRARDTDFIGLTSPPDYDEGAAFVGDTDAYYRASGTSFSAALVSGLASRLLGNRPQLSADEVRRILVQSAEDVGAEGVDQVSGYGRADYVRALAAAPDAFIRARLSGVDLSLEGEQIWLAVQGDADAKSFAGAELAVRAAPGSVAVPEEDPKAKKKKKKDEPETPSPYDWQAFGAGIRGPVAAGTLGRLDLDTLTAMTGGAKAWELRLVVHDATGGARESRMTIALPVPDAAQTEAAE